MQRPVMDPSWYELPQPASRGPRLQWVRTGAKQAARLLVVDLFWWRRKRARLLPEGSLGTRILRSALHWLLFLPPVILLLSAALVYRQTHPPVAVAVTSPVDFSLYYEPVTLLSDDGVRLDATLFPVLDARRVLDRREKVLREVYPAVVLVRDPFVQHQSVDPLIRPLHEAGMVVLVLNLRHGSAGRTFGLRESLDVRAAVRMLGRRSFVDPRRIAVVGAGAGANAALIAAGRDGEIAVLSLESPLPDRHQALDYLAPPGTLLGALRPICRWAFELGYQSDLDDLDLRHHADLLQERPALLFSHPADPDLAGARNRQITQFLAHHLATSPSSASRTARVD